MEIDSHLNLRPTPSLADFEFDPAGIVVGGRPYPIVVMEWIEGPTLDLYVEQVLGNKPTLLYLAEEWLKAVEGLRKAQVAHGDLQHGNIIVQNSQVRLIDLDGMYVPAMRGWQSNELGHIHYQHPQRTTSTFNLELDNFSSIVIYLSFVALSEAPELWKEFHDENLIFTKSDFLDPGSSKLFARIRKLSQHARDVANILEKAAKGKVVDTPSLLTIATPKTSKLPAWMTAPVVEIEVRTREASGQSVPPQLGTIRSAQSTSTAPPVTSTATTLPPQPVSGATAPKRASFDWSKVHSSAWPKAFKIALWGILLVWVWGPILGAIGEGIGVASADKVTFVFWTYIIGCISVAYLVAIIQQRAARTPPSRSSGTQVLQQPQQQWSPPPRPTWTRHKYSPQRVPSTPPVSAGQFVGSKIRFIYHRPTCEWALKMSRRNRVSFASIAAARASGYRPCKVCRP
jgi:hypothetical protein